METTTDTTSNQESQGIDVSVYHNQFSLRNKIMRAVWQLTWTVLCRPTPRNLNGWRRLVLRLFGAEMGVNARVMGTTTIWAPWNLKMADYSCLADHVNCYCVDRVEIGAHVTVSQYSYLCTASHDISDPHMALTTAPITIGAQAWVCADVFVGPGVTVGEGAVVGARSSVFKDVPPWKIAVGNPAVPIKDRVINQPNEAE